MSARITVTATGGPCKGREFVFTGRTVCTVGRSDNCLFRIQGGACDLTVSRRHCLLDIDPPAVRVRDLGSLNGTLVNGRKIGQREKGAPVREAAPADLEWVELYDGDRLAVGGCEFLVGIQRGAVNHGT
jgi:pSer/pThr/pTyr-binding forkhead associated (FHA) protein